jgi:hypothetical protein
MRIRCDCYRIRVYKLYQRTQAVPVLPKTCVSLTDFLRERWSYLKTSLPRAPPGIFPMGGGQPENSAYEHALKTFKTTGIFIDRTTIFSLKILIVFVVNIWYISFSYICQGDRCLVCWPMSVFCFLVCLTELYWCSTM